MKNLLAVSFALILTISYLLLATQWQFEPQPTSAVQQASTHQPTPTPSPSPTARPRPHHTPTPVPLPTAVPTSLPTNGDFSNGSDGWTIETFIGCGSHSEVRFLGQDGPNSNVVQFIAEGNGGCYTDAKLLQILDIEVPANSQMVVSADVKSVHSAVRGPCGDTGSEMPLHIQLEYVTDQEQDRRILWSFTHKTGGTCGIRNGWRDDRYSSDFDNEYYANITVPHNEWYSFTSEDAKAIDPAMARLTWLGILGNGWDRDSRIDNIHLSMTTPTRAPTAVDDHGDTPSGSTLIPVSSEWYGSIEDGDDVDFFSFRASGGHEYVIETHLDSNPDTVLALYDPAGDVIDHHDDSGSGGGERMVWVAPSTDTYYIEVMGYEGATGTYFLTLIEVATPAPTAAPARVADDHGDTPSGSTLIPVSSEWYGSIEDGDDVDFFSFRASGGHEYVIETHLDSNPDTVLALYDPAGDVIDHHDDSGSGGGERMVWVAPSTDTYYIEVMGYEGATGTYFLTLIEVAIGSSRQGGELRLAPRRRAEARAGRGAVPLQLHADREPVRRCGTDQQPNLQPPVESRGLRGGAGPGGVVERIRRLSGMDPGSQARRALPRRPPRHRPRRGILLRSDAEIPAFLRRALGDRRPHAADKLREPHRLRLSHRAIRHRNCRAPGHAGLANKQLHQSRRLRPVRARRV